MEVQTIVDGRHEYFSETAVVYTHEKPGMANGEPWLLAETPSSLCEVRRFTVLAKDGGSSLEWESKMVAIAFLST